MTITEPGASRPAPGPLRIGLLAPPWVAVPPSHYGGTEAVIDVLARGLRALGHEVVLFATGDSTCPVERRSVFARALGTDSMTSPSESCQVVAGYEALADCDLIHDHTFLGPLLDAAPAGVPVVATNHGPFLPELGDAYRAMADRAAIVAISHDQRRTIAHVLVAAVIHHGLDLDRFPVGDGQGDYAVFLGRMSPDKGPDRAIRAARAAGVQLVLAAKLREADEIDYFRSRVQPLLGEHAVFLGEVGGDAKALLLGEARCLVNPVEWPEPFGLVMAESLACGTPVVASPHGAAPEIVQHGVTGFLASGPEELAEAIDRTPRLDRSRCRAAALERFSAQRMVAEHLDLYPSVLRGEVGGRPAAPLRGRRRA